MPVSMTVLGIVFLSGCGCGGGCYCGCWHECGCGLCLVLAGGW